MTNNTTVLKLGGSVLTDKNKINTPLEDQILRIVQEIADSPHDGLVLIHGAGSCGHPQAIEHGLDKEMNVRGALITHNAVKNLNSLLVGALADAGVDCLPIHPLSCIVTHDGRITNMNLEPIQLMLSKKIVPVLHGDVVLDTLKGVAILSGDQITTYLAERLGATQIGVGTNVDGILNGENETIAQITPGTLDETLRQITKPDKPDITGGMPGKIKELIQLAEKNIPSCVFNASTSGNISKFLRGEKLGTTILPE